MLVRVIHWSKWSIMGLLSPDGDENHCNWIGSERTMTGSHSATRGHYFIETDANRWAIEDAGLELISSKAESSSPKSPQHFKNLNSSQPAVEAHSSIRPLNVHHWWINFKSISNYQSHFEFWMLKGKSRMCIFCAVFCVLDSLWKAPFPIPRLFNR